MLKSCKYCGGIHSEDYICPLKPQKKYKEREQTDAVTFRNTNKWRKKRKEILERDAFLCRECLINKAIVTKGLEVHHIVPINEDYSRRLDDDNLITLCSYHHKQAEDGTIDRKHLSELANSPPYDF